MNEAVLSQELNVRAVLLWLNTESLLLLPPTPPTLMFRCCIVFASLLIGYLSASVLLAQSQIEGLVVDRVTGDVIRGANVSIPNTYYGAISGIDGKFILKTNITPPLTVTISREGYEKFQVKVDSVKQKMTVVLSKSGAKNRVEGASAPEYQLKLAFLEKFIEMTTWPGQKKSDSAFITIGIYGKNPFGEDLFGIERKRLKDQNIRVIFLDSPEYVEAVDVLFIPDLPAPVVADLANVLKGKPVLSICDVGVAQTDAGVIRFLHVDGKVRFACSKPLAAQAGLALDPLLEAMSVK